MPAAPPPLWRAPEPLLLASTSATRLSLLVAAGLPVETRSSGVDERAVQAGLAPGTSPAALAARLTDLKARAVAGREPGRVVLGADQVLALDGEPLAKPASDAEARRQLRRLSGRAHDLHSAATLVADGAAVPVAATATLRFRDLSQAEIDGYVARLRGSGAGWASGLYQVEALGQHLVAAIEGDHATILGLPMLPLLAALRERGLVGL